VPSTATEPDRLIRDQAHLMAAAIRHMCGRRLGALAPDLEQHLSLALAKRLAAQPGPHSTGQVYKAALAAALAVVRGLAPEEPEPGGPGTRPQLIQEALTRLDPDEARALRAYLAGFNHQEAARLFGWSESVARQRIFQGMDLLRARMGGG
jgi:hypothetical protein